MQWKTLFSVLLLKGKKRWLVKKHSLLTHSYGAEKRLNACILKIYQVILIAIKNIYLKLLHEISCDSPQSISFKVNLLL